ncbi:MAG: hypothetical protein GX080_05095 [Tissierellia bacterium]|nr:hypothetical protein [Tissierellia bacterium]
MSKGDKDRKIDKNFFKEMNYEIAGELGILDNDDMKKNKKIKDVKRSKIDDEDAEYIINPS